MVQTSRLGEELKARIAAAWPAICDAVSEGAHVGDTFKRYGFTRGQCAAFQSYSPEGRADWEKAREASADSFFDQAQAIANSPGPDAKIARVKLQALQWLAGKRNPRAYGDRSVVDLNVRSVDLTRIISDANARLAAARVIEGQVVPALLSDLL